MGFLQDLFRGKPKIPRTDVTKRFELICRIGQGSMSRFFKARDTKSGRIVGLKLLDGEKTRKFEARFPPELKKPLEGEVAVTLDHPNIVRTLEWGETLEGDPFLVMEFLEGVSLSYLIDVQNEVMRENRLSFIIQLGEGLKYLHENRWIHRDVCPRNVIVTEPDLVVKLIDFGLVVPNTPPFQAPGNRTGTANYMAPELVRRQKTNQRIDIYSYAVTCFEMYTRRHPWPEAASLDAVIQHINSPPADIAKLVPEIDPQIATTIMKGLEAEPARRWQRVEQMVEQFREALDRQPAAPRQPTAATSDLRPAPAEPQPPQTSQAPEPSKSPRQKGAAPQSRRKRGAGASDEDFILDILSTPDDPSRGEAR
ncbi:MAG: serine/threonine protein kinase [Planctomycetaceae bacterium]|nr:MAG: serine/threonine protein kinase [Planctomycetaceae bacterium]